MSRRGALHPPHIAADSILGGTKKTVAHVGSDCSYLGHNLGSRCFRLRERPEHFTQDGTIDQLDLRLLRG